MPRYNCLLHNQVMAEKIKKNKIQPYCVECRKVHFFNEEMKTYMENEEWNRKAHKRELKSEYIKNIFNSFAVSFKLLLFILFPTYIIGSILSHFISSSTLTEIYGGFAVLLISLLFLKALLTFPDHPSPYSEPTKEDIEKRVEFERDRNLDEVKRFKENLQKEYMIRSTRIEEVDQMDGFEFEVFVANLLRKIGYENVNVTKKSGDGGVDILATNLQGEKTAIQCKRLKSKVGNAAIQEIFLGKRLKRCKKGMVITNSYFTKPAFEAAVDSGIELWSRNRLIEVMREIEPQFSWEEYLRSFYVLPKGRQRIS